MNPGGDSAEGLERTKAAEHLELNSEKIVAEWMNAVEGDDQIPSADRMTATALRDHFPELLQELAGAIRRVDADGKDVRRTARAHGRARWRDGYRVDEAIRELNKVAQMVIIEVKSVTGLSELIRAETTQTTRAFFDTIIAESAGQFVKAQQAEIDLRQTQLQHACHQGEALTDTRQSSVQSRAALLRAALHELRNALHAVSLASSLMSGPKKGEERNETRDMICHSAGHLQRVMDRMGKIASLMADEIEVRPRDVDLSAVLVRLDHHFRPLARTRGLVFECRCSTRLITSDAEILERVAFELISNAISFTQKGFIRVEAFEADGNRCVLRVSDSGIGIDDKIQKQIFSEFHHASEEPGIHLGLVAARHLTHLLGGQMRFKSARRVGSQFEVDLPLG